MQEAVEADVVDEQPARRVVRAVTVVVLCLVAAAFGLVIVGTALVWSTVADSGGSDHGDGPAKEYLGALAREPIFRDTPAGAKVIFRRNDSACVDPGFDRREPYVNVAYRSAAGIEPLAQQLSDTLRRDGWSGTDIEKVRAPGIADQWSRTATKTMPGGWNAQIQIWAIADHPNVVTVTGKDTSRTYC